MSEKPHTVAIGAFIVGAGLIALSLVIFLLGSQFGDKEKVVMVFDGSVKGLNIGAPLALRGVQVGQVTDIEIILDEDSIELIMVVEADFHSKNIRRRGSTDKDITEELIERGLRAQLQTQSLLTGLLFIQLDFHPGSKLVLADIDSPYFQFPTVPTDLERITKKLQDIDISNLSNDLENVVDGINTFVNNEEFQGMPASIKTTLDSLTGLSNQLQQQLAITAPKLDKVLDGAATTVATANTELPKLSALVRDNLKVLNTAIAAFENTMDDLDGLVAYDSATMYRLNQALRELSLAGKAVQELANTLEEQPESLIRGKRGDK
jgi:paraquat-inducible protein B